jgi:4'-phosphopantetheinyl transferase
MNVYWLQQSVADLPEQNDWLSTSDMARLNGMRFEKRRADWRLGRWTAKRALAVYLNLPADHQALAEIEIRPALSGAPEVFLANKPADVTISLSHRAGIANCAIAVSGAALGCDLEIVEPRSDAFVADYFTIEEQELVARTNPADRFPLLALLWSAKESALKALREGLRLDTRSVAVKPWAVRSESHDEASFRDDPALAFQPFYGSNSWRPLHVRFDVDQVFQGWWKLTNNVLETMVANPSPSQPILLLEAGLCLSSLNFLPKR